MCLVAGDAYIYENPVGEGEWLVAYWGDNLYEPTFPGYECWWGKEKNKNLRKIAEKIVEWMENNAVIVYDWEVWT